MKRVRPIEFHIETSCLRLSAKEAPWDSAIYGMPVVQIKKIEVLDEDGAAPHYAHYENWIEAEQIGIVSCRLPHDRLRESMFLEAQGFRFIEMVLHPRLDLLQTMLIPADPLLIAPAAENDLKTLQDIGEHAFGYERFHVDPRLDPRLGDQRYGRWIRNSLHYKSPRLLKILDGERLVALFIVETKPDQSVYWHLTAIAPQCQGQGYGRRVWRAMLRYHQEEGCQAVATTISARNTPVLNLYSQLQFRFTPPEMTFHWLRKGKRAGCVCES